MAGEELLVSMAVFLIPLYVANSTAMLFGNGNPLDGNRKAWDGQPWLGKGKTVRGTLSGILCGTMASLIVALLFQNQTGFSTGTHVLFGFLVSAGAMAGDMAGSFLKRRFLIESSAPTPVLDQLSFLFGGLLFSFHLYQPSAYEVLVLGVFTVITHLGSNYLAYQLKIKKVPW